LLFSRLFVYFFIAYLFYFAKVYLTAVCVSLYLVAYISCSTVPVQSITKRTYITGLVIFSPVTMATCDVTAVCSMRLSGYQLTTERLLGPVGWMPRSTAAVTGGGLSMNTNFRTNSSLHRSISCMASAFCLNGA